MNCEMRKFGQANDKTLQRHDASSPEGRVQRGAISPFAVNQPDLDRAWRHGCTPCWCCLSLIVRRRRIDPDQSLDHTRSQSLSHPVHRNRFGNVLHADVGPAEVLNEVKRGDKMIQIIMVRRMGEQVIDQSRKSFGCSLPLHGRHQSRTTTVNASDHSLVRSEESVTVADQQTIWLSDRADFFDQVKCGLLVARHSCRHE